MENKNMALYDRVKAVPADAQKEIAAGRLKGMTDINPMWRIEKLTELFGPCGTGWGTNHVNYSKDEYLDEVVLTCTLELWYKNEDGFKSVFGVGSSKLVTKERNGIYVDDEAYKKAYTDAISVGAKALGVGAEIYRFGKSRADSKYESSASAEPASPAKREASKPQKWEKPFAFTQEDIYEVCRRLGKSLESAELYSADKYGTNIAGLTQEQRDELGNLLWAVAEKGGRV